MTTDRDNLKLALATIDRIQRDRRIERFAMSLIMLAAIAIARAC